MEPEVDTEEVKETTETTEAPPDSAENGAGSAENGTDWAEPPDDDDDENNTDSNPLKITPVSEIVNGSEKLTIEDTTEASET